MNPNRSPNPRLARKLARMRKVNNQRTQDAFHESVQHAVNASTYAIATSYTRRGIIIGGALGMLLGAVISVVVLSLIRG